MIILKSEADLDGMRVSGRIAGEVLKRVSEAVSPGVETSELSRYAGELMRSRGAESAFLGYRGFPGEICVSVNDAVVHGIPGPRRIEMGDIVSLDVGVRYGGYIGDTAATVMVGVSDLDLVGLVRTAQDALAAGIAAARPGKRLSCVSHAIEGVIRQAGLAVVREFVGHGIGRSLHEDPQVPNFGAPNRGPMLKEGMTLALEPMVNLGTGGVRVADDGWTALTRDGRPSAHFEHTIAVRDGEAEILTKAS